MNDAVEANRAELEELAERDDLRVSKYAQALLEVSDG